MPRFQTSLLGLLCVACMMAPAAADDAAKKAPAEPAEKSAKAVSFITDVAPILVENCIACHNPRKSESKFIMTSFAQLAKGGQQGEGMTLEPGDPDASYIVELIRLDGEPRMPYKQDPLPPEKIKLIESWVKQGAKYDGADPNEDWTAALHKLTPAVIPENYPVAVPITALAFSPDGVELASAGYHEVNLWKAADGSLGRRLRPLDERVYDIVYSPDGKWLATASGDPGQYGAVKLWLAEPNGGGKAVRDLAEGSDCFFAVAFSPDSKLLAAAGADRTIRIWDVDTGKSLAAIEDHADWILDLAFSPDGKRLASASRDKTSKVFDVAKKESLVTFPGHAETVYTVAFSPDGKSVATGGADNQIRIWNPDEDGKQIRGFGGFGGAVFRLQFTPNGKQLVACSADKTVRVFDAANGSSIRTLSGHQDWVYSFAISSDGNTLASGSWDGEVRLWAMADGKPGLTFLAAPGLKAPTTPPVAAK
ncbi:MAG TPA: c-type cytochrome domain-containing protein [Isosphaeraceae bacterium]|nr:c-type cytochrome domain-containing protein [Isosphaeraceae bacterium]